MCVSSSLQQSGRRTVREGERKGRKGLAIDWHTPLAAAVVLLCRPTA